MSVRLLCMTLILIILIISGHIYLQCSRRHQNYFMQTCSEHWSGLILNNGLDLKDSQQACFHYSY